MRASVLALVAALALAAPAAAQRSGYEDMSPAIRALQDDEMSNPASLWVLRGEALWAEKAGTSGRACAECHGAADKAMAGVAARYPARDKAVGRALTLEQRVNRCRTEHQGAEPLAPESEALLGITAYIGRQSRGQPMAVAGEGPEVEAGRAFFHLRQGQLNLSCAQCHDDNKGQRLAGNIIPEGHPNGYPIYRLEWQTMGSLARRIRNCLTGVRAQPLDRDSPTHVALELYLGWRATGLKVETPGVRP